MYSSSTSSIIDCEDCSHPYETIRKNTKRCSVCGLIRGLAYVALRDKVVECRLCPNKYLPIESGDVLCAECAQPSSRAGAGECAYCHATKPFVRVDVAVCHACAQDPKHRKLLFRSLKRKQKDRQEADRSGVTA